MKRHNRNGSGRAIGGMAKYLTPNTPENPFLSDRIDRTHTLLKFCQLPGGVVTNKQF